MSNDMRPDIEAAWSQVSNNFGKKRDINKLPEYLNEGETVLAITGGIVARKNGLLVATNRRALFVAEGVVNQADRSSARDPGQHRDLLPPGNQQQHTQDHHHDPHGPGRDRVHRRQPLRDHVIHRGNEGAGAEEIAIIRFARRVSLARTRSPSDAGRPQSTAASSQDITVMPFAQAICASDGVSPPRTASSRSS